MPSSHPARIRAPRRRAVVLTCALTLLLTTLAPATAGARDRGSATSAPLPADTRLVTGRPGETIEADAEPLPIEELIAGHVDALDPATYPDALPGYLRQEWAGATVPLEPAGAEDPAAPTQTTDAGVFATRFGHADFSGDGLDDVLVRVSDAGSEAYEVRAYAGTDGRLLWHIPSSELRTDEGRYFVDELVVDDLDRDGHDDLFYGEYRILSDTYTSYDCPTADDCVYERFATYEWEWHLRSGRDGRIVWSALYPGDLHVSYANTYSALYGYSTHVEVESTALAALPAPGFDHDRDGTPDVLVNVIDVAYEIHDDREDVPAGQREGRYRYRARTDGVLLDGGTGRRIATLSAEGQGMPFLQSVGNAVGDATPDLAWAVLATKDDDMSCASVLFLDTCTDGMEIAEDLRYEVVDGATATGAWEVTAPLNAVPGVYALRDDLDGDGYTDFLFRRIEDQVTGTATRYSLLAGPDGHEVWSRLRDDGVPFSRVLDMGGTPGPDLLFRLRSLTVTVACLVPVDCTVGATTIALEVLRIDGRTGEVFSDTSRSWTSPDGGGMFLGEERHDYDGDGAVDLELHGMLAHEGREDTGYSLIQSARTGEDLLVLEERPGHIWTTAVGDLDGDRVQEVSTYTWPEGIASDTAPTRRTYSLVDGREFWQSDPSLDVVALGDQDGVAGDDVVRPRHLRDADGRLRAFLDGLRGDTLDARWTIEVAPLP